MRTVSMLVTGAAVAVFALAPSAAQGQRSSLPDGFPSTWRAVDGADVDFQDHTYTNYRLIRSVFELRSDKGGDKAYLSVVWRVGRFSTGKAAICAGRRYVGRYVVDSRTKPGEAWFALAGPEARAHLTITRRIDVFKKSTQVGPPLCVETTGTWSGSGGVLLGYHRTFVFTHDDALVLR